MSIVGVDFDGKPVNLDPSSLLDLKNASSDLMFIFGGALQAYLNQPLSSVPANTSADLTLNAGNPSWQLAGSPAKFSLGANAKFTISIQQPNQTLFSYNPDLENSQAQKVNISGKAGSCYVIIEGLFNISGTLSGAGSIGSVGVTADASGTAAYTVRNYKALPPTTSLKDAIVKALSGFTLPLHQSTAANLSDGDCIYYEFDGSLNVGFGATWGISAQVGATTISEINQSLQKAGGIVSVLGLTPVTVSAGANLSMQFNWTRSFQCFLWRQQPTAGQAGGALLYISAGRTSKRVIQLGIDAEVKGIGTPKASVDAGKATQLILSKLTGQQNPPAGTAIGQKVQQAVTPYLADVNNWLGGLTQKVSTAAGKGVALSVYYQNQSSFTSAFTWHFDFTKPQSGAAWDAAMQGDFLKALATGAVTLDPGSGYEQTNMRATGISLTLFGVWQFSAVEQFFDNATVSYAGNGRFNLEYKAGQSVTTTVNNKVYVSSIYLSATATGAVNTPGTQLDLSNVNLQLHGDLSIKGDTNQQAQFGTLVNEIGNALQSNGGNRADLSRLGGNWKSSQGGNATLDVVFEKNALQRLSADGHASGQKPPFARDAANWKNYASASDRLGSEPVNYFQGQIDARGYNFYDSWRKFNCAVNGYITSASDPTPVLDDATRVHPPTQSPLSISVLALMRQPGYFEGTSNDQDGQLGVYFGAGQEYMNLCGDTQDLLQQIASSKVDWTTLMARMKTIAGDDVNAWFGPVILLALAMSCQCKSATIQGSTLTSSSATATVNLS
jgi:hypothetical protein